MSTLVENIQKVQNAHAALKQVIAAKGVSVPEGTKLTGMPALVEQIETPVVPLDPQPVIWQNTATSIEVPKVVGVDFSRIDFSSYFKGYQYLKSLTIQAGVGRYSTSLYYCFSGCTALTSLTLPEHFGENSENLERCFSGCSKLASLTLPDGFGQNATNLKYCFNGCTSLTSLSLPSLCGQVAESLDHCFQTCKALTSLTLPRGFGKYATNLSYCFSGCSSLESLTLPKDFGQEATNLTNCFYNCSALTTITGNPSFKSSLSFSSCTKLTHDSLMVIIYGLQFVSSSRTLTLGSMNLAKLTNEEKQIATDMGWTLA